MKRSRIALVGLAIVLVLLAGLFAWQASVLADPLAAPQGSNPNAPLATPQPLSSYQRIQNLDPVAASTMTVTVYDTGGGVVGTAVTSTNPFYSRLIDERSWPGSGSIPSGFAGSGVVNATTDIAAITNETSGSGLGKAFRMDSYNAIPGPSVATSISFPQVLWNITDAGAGVTYTSTIAFQNAGTSSADLTITYFPATFAGYTCASNPVILTRTGVAPNASYYLNMGSVPEFSSCTLPGGAISGTYGSMSITSTWPIAAVVNHNADGVLGATLGYISSDGATTISVPQAVKNITDTAQNLTLGTAQQVFTQNGLTATVYATFNTLLSGSFGTCTGGGAPSVIQYSVTANPVAVFDQRLDPHISTACWYGSATFTSTTPIISVVNAVSVPDATRGMRLSIVRALPFGTGTTQAYVPHIARGWSSTEGITWGTAFQARQESGGAGTLYVHYYVDGFGTCSETRPLSGAGSVAVLDQRVFDFSVCGGAPSTNIIGSAFMTSTVPFVVTVNQVGNATDQGDALGQYTGINR